MNSCYPECAVLPVYITFEKKRKKKKERNVCACLLNCLPLWFSPKCTFCLGANQMGYPIRALRQATPTLISKHEPATPSSCHFKQGWLL